jgi:pyruvate kinase
MSTRYPAELLGRLHAQLTALRTDALALAEEQASLLAAMPPDYAASARNLLHYLAVRRHDIRALQIQLGELGLSSLGRMEAHVLAALESVLAALESMTDEALGEAPMGVQPARFREGDERLARHAADLFGPEAPNRIVRIMVTLPSEAARDYGLVRDLVASGMNIARINSAHDEPAAWRGMVERVRRAEGETGRGCRVLLDLAGPKLRTGPLAPGPEVLRLRPERDDCGRIGQPARLRLVAEGAEPAAQGERVLPVDPVLFGLLRAGDELRLRDLPGRARRLRVADGPGGSLWIETRRGLFFASGLPLQLYRKGVAIWEGHIGTLPAREQRLLLAPSDTLLVTAGDDAGAPARRDREGALLEPARIPCTLPEVFADTRPGDRILFDDGRIEGVIRECTPSFLRVEVRRAAAAGSRLQADRGINLPDTNLSLSPLTEADLGALDFAVRHADLVGMSFVRRPEDVAALHAELARRGGERLGVIVKIETGQAFENLPSLLLAALSSPPAGVMVARGDLGVELGFERMAEVQEEILWLAEAAHLPVIWATQVLETLTKTGTPTRSEVTDAAMSARAECVMLNKGPYVVDAVRFVDNIMMRMRDHNHKKTPMLRRLKISEGRWRDWSAANGAGVANGGK